MKRFTHFLPVTLLLIAIIIGCRNSHPGEIIGEAKSDKHHDYIKHLEVLEKYAVVNYGYENDIFNISNPSDPHLVGKLNLEDYESSMGIEETWVRRMISNKKYVFLVTNSHCIIVNISNPTTPEIINTIPVLPGYEMGSGGRLIRDITTFGNKLFVSTVRGILIIDISNPLDVSVEQTTLDADLVFAMSESHLLIVNEETLQIIDLSNSKEIRVIGSTPISSSPESMTVSGDFAFLGFTGIMQVFNIAKFEAPKPMGSCSLPDWVGNGSAIWRVSVDNMIVSGSYIYLSFSSSSILAFDISDPNELKKIDNFFSASGSIEDISIYNNYLYAIADKVIGTPNLLIIQPLDENN